MRALALSFMLLAPPVAAETLSVQAIILCETSDLIREAALGGPVVPEGCDKFRPLPGKVYSFTQAQAIPLAEYPGGNWCNRPHTAKTFAFSWLHSETGAQMTGFAMTCEAFSAEAIKGSAL